MNKFSISQLEQFSGIKAHTIRIWEQRYNALNPNRSQGNTRSYDNSQLRRLLNIVSLSDSDYKVSELCSMPDAKLYNLIKSELISKDEKSGSAEYFVSQLIAASVDYDTLMFENIFAACQRKYDVKNLYTKVIYPLLNRVGLMWSCDTMPPAQEHFISNIIRQKLFAAIDNLQPEKTSKDSWVLFLPENEFHETGLLFSYFLIKQTGKKVIYLGPNVPIGTLTSAVKDTSPSNLLFFFVHKNLQEEYEAYCNSLLKTFSGVKIYVAGDEKLKSDIKIGRRITWISSVDELEKELK